MAKTCSDIGGLLKQSREKREMKISDVARKLNIRPAYIRAMEDGRFSDLPGSIYCMGYLKNYSEMLGLASRELLEDLKEASAELTRKEIKFLQGDPYSLEVKPSGMTILFSLLLSISLYIVWYGSKKLLENSSDNRDYQKAKTEMILEEIRRLEKEK